MLKYLKTKLTENGQILLAINNKLGIKYLSGACSEFTKEKLYSKEELRSIISNCNFASFDFYYPLPDYKITNVIYSDKYIPSYNDSKLMYNLNYLEGSIVSQNELESIKDITKAGMFDKFANSFFVILKNSDLKTKNDEVKFISYNNMRKEEYRVITKILDKKVEKIANSKESEKHIQTIKEAVDTLSSFGFKMLDSFENGKVYSRFCDKKSFSKVLLDMYRKNSKEEVLNKIKYWYDSVIKRLPVMSEKEAISHNIFSEVGIEVNENIIKKLHFTEFGFFDLVFENCFVDDNDLLFYDQEWILKCLPLEFIMYRAINNIYLYDFDIEKIIPKDEVLKFLDVFGFEDIFEELEIYIQFKVLDKKRVTSYSKSYEAKVNYNDYTDMKKYIKNLEDENEKLRMENEELKNSLQPVKDEMESIKKTAIWKIYKMFKK